MRQDLSEAEIERLAERLATFPGALSLEAVDGLFCALIAAPGLTMPRDYLPVILATESSESGAFENMEDAQETIGLLMRYWNAIAGDFEKEGLHMARVEEPGTDGITGRDWARGFMRGTHFSPEEWNRIFQDEEEAALLAIAIVAGVVDAGWPKEPLTQEKSDELLSAMFAGAARAYRYFKADRMAQAGSSGTRSPRVKPYERETPKTGRNDPCPCGSGKKFKRCCGRTSPEDGTVH